MPAKRRQSKSAAKQESDEEEMETKQKQGRGKKRISEGGDTGAAAAQSKKRKLSAKSEGDAKESAAENPQMKTVVVKGKAPVDSECGAKVGVAHVYCSGADIYDAMLNQTNVQFNNNKYYIIQLLEDDNSKTYSVWYRWGRVGKVGQNKLEPYGPNLDRAKQAFCKKFAEKTKNDWDLRDNFHKVPGKYDMLAMDYSTKEDKKEKKKPNGSQAIKKECKLESTVQALLSLICDLNAMEAAVMEMQYDARKAPLGRLTEGQIKAGYKALKAIEACIKKGITGGQALVQACNDFYTRIPHDFGMRVPPLIHTWQDVKAKMELLEALGDIEIAMTVMRRADDQSSEHPLDATYKSMGCDLRLLDHSSDHFKMINDYLHKTHASTHRSYKMELLDTFECVKQEEANKFHDVGNRMLLWHGSRLSNWMGILTQGLRIAPPEAPSTGYMFGKGVYFADMSSKSANYAYPTRSKNVGLVVLCEVALGNCHELIDADEEASQLPPGKHSVKGLGQIQPNPKEWQTLPDGLIVPVGKPVPSSLPSTTSGYTLNYNEYVVYDTRQIRMRYLLKIKFNF